MGVPPSDSKQVHIEVDVTGTDGGVPTPMVPRPVDDTTKLTATTVFYNELGAPTPDVRLGADTIDTLDPDFFSVSVR